MCYVALGRAIARFIRGRATIEYAGGEGGLCLRVVCPVSVVFMTVVFNNAVVGVVVLLGAVCDLISIVALGGYLMYAMLLMNCAVDEAISCDGQNVR